MSDREFTVGDLEPNLTGVLLSNGQPVGNLAGASFVAHIRKPDGTPLSKTVTITDAPTAAWTAADWVVGDLNAAGVWDYEVEVTWGDGRPQTFPGEPFYVAPQLA